MAPARLAAWFSLGVLCSVGVFSAGCSVIHRKQSVTWSKAIQARPRLVALRETAADPPELMPELHMNLGPLPSPSAVAQPVPSRTRTTTTVTSSGGTAERTEVPVIAPQLTAEEAAAAREQANRSMNTAERNLASTNGKNLSPPQMDIASKVRSFLSDARDAARGGDWIRARDLAKKAQVLSEELARSF